MKKRKKALFAAAALALSLLVLLTLAEALSYGFVKRSGWFTSWEYLTVKDRELGFRLRPETQARVRDLVIRVNKSGVRDVRTDSVVEPRREDELLVLVTGDSNAFGNLLNYEKTFPALVERILKQYKGGKVRVVNAAVSGYSSFQCRLALVRWMELRPDVVVYAECFNDRAYGKRADSREAFEAEYSTTRKYEIRGRICYLRLLLGTLLAKKGDDRGRLLPIAGPLPEPRVAPDKLRVNLEAMAELCRAKGSRLILVATGEDPAIEGPARQGRMHLKEQQWRQAEDVFRGLTELKPAAFLNWHYYYEAHLRGNNLSRSKAIEDQYRRSASSGYLDQFLHYSDEYAQIMRDAAADSGATFVDMRADFQKDNVKFADVCHFSAKGHLLIATRVCERVLSTRLRR